MLTEQQIETNKIKYMELMSKLNVDLTKFMHYLDYTGYFYKPASTQYFNAYPGGLCKYTLDLYYELSQLVSAYAPGVYTEQDIIIVTLLKDLYKAEFYEMFVKNVKDEATGQWHTEPGYRVAKDRTIYGDMGFSSYMTVRKLLDYDFTDEQIEVLTQSTTDEKYNSDMYEVFRKYKLVTLMKMADMAARYLDAE